MEMLDKDTFKEFTRQVFDSLDRHERLIASLTGSNLPSDLKEVKLLDGERLFDNQDLCLCFRSASAACSVTAVQVRSLTTVCGTRPTTRNPMCWTSSRNI